MHLYQSCWIFVVGLTCHFNLWTIFHFSLWCHFSHVFLLICVLLKASKGHFIFPSMCYNLHASHLTLCRITHFLSPKVNILSLTHSHGQGITLPPIVGTPTPKCVRFSWKFISKRSLECWYVQHHEHLSTSLNGAFAGSLWSHIDILWYLLKVLSCVKFMSHLTIILFMLGI